MKQLLRIILDAVFPPTVHELCLRQYAPAAFSQLYRPTIIGTHTALSQYEHRSVQAAVAACKFENNHYAAKLLSTLLATWLSLHTRTGTTLIIPLPLSSARKKERGFNQVERVLTYLPVNQNHCIATRFLARTHDTTRQTSLNRIERQQNMQGAFAATSAALNNSWDHITRVIICDDVLTTGATLTAARVALAPHLPRHIELVTLAWAH
jgi:predicted amidophosphoribosyltransferase